MAFRSLRQVAGRPLFARAGASGAALPGAQGSGGSSAGATEVAPASIDRWWLPLVLIAAVALCVPFFRTVFSLGDEGVLLHGAEQILQGKTIYTDFFEFLPPGGFVFTAAWLHLAGLSVWAVRTLAIVTIAGIACLIYLACRVVSKSAPLSAALTIGWVVMSQGVWTQLSHHWITTMFSMVTVWAALAEVEQARRWWPVIAGLASGAAAMVTPTCGAFAMLAALTVFSPARPHRVAFISFVLSCAVVPAGLIVWLVRQHAFVAAFQDVIVFTAANYASIQRLPFGTGSGMENVPLIFLFPLAACLALLVCGVDRRGVAKDRTLWACAAFGFAGFTTSYPRPDVFHIAFEIPLLCPLLAYCASRLTAAWRPAFRAAAAGVVAVLLIPSVLMVHAISQYVSRTEVMPTPRGGLAFFKLDGAPEMIGRIASLPPGDGFFFYPFMPMMPFLTAREQVSKYDILTPGYSLPSQYQDACLAVMRHATWIVIDRLWMDPKTLRAAFPAMRDPQPPETRAFEQALADGFNLVAQEGTFELRRRRNGVSERACVGIAK
jgi:hypothetical protein